ncbi:MAG: phosphopentomutase [Firmicutes bacterium]|nr:phosphopentomutase [Bacillota bacterium]
MKLSGRRIFLIVLDSMGVGAAPDAADFGDEGSNTLGAIRDHEDFNCPNLRRLGLFNIEGVGGGPAHPAGAFGRLQELSKGKDTTSGHWEIAGLISEEAMPTFPDGFPDEIIEEFSRRTGRGVLCNKPYSGTDVIRDYGKEHERTGALIVYTSADSVFQIAAHESVVPVEELYQYCETARELLTGKYAVGRVIARPFEGEWPYVRTSRRHDYSLMPPKDTMLDIMQRAGLDTISVGKIWDIFAGKGLSESNRTEDNADGMAKTLLMSLRDFNGICFTNLVDFDAKYGHRNDVAGYARAMSEFDRWLPAFLENLEDDDLVFITADHGCDPSTPSTDHSREYIPVVIYGENVIPGADIGTRIGFSDIAATILDCFGLDGEDTAGTSFKELILREPRSIDPDELPVF